MKEIISKNSEKHGTKKKSNTKNKIDSHLCFIGARYISIVIFNGQMLKNMIMPRLLVLAAVIATLSSTCVRQIVQKAWKEF